MREKAAGLLAVPALVLAGLGGAPSDALAQQDPAAARACTSITADAERLACYDRALRAAPAEHPQTGRSESTPPRTESSPAAPTASTPPARSETRAQRKARKESAAKKNELEVTIVKVDEIRGRGDLFFITDDGQVWRQTDEKSFYPPKPPFHALISTSRFGTQFLSLPGGHVQIRVFQEQQ